MSIRFKAPKNLAGQLGIDLRPLGKPVPIERLTPGALVLAVNETWIASGSIRETSQTGSYYDVTLNIDGSPTIAYVRSPALFFRVDPDTHRSTPSRFARLFGARPVESHHARTITNILGTPFTPTEIKLNDEGRHVVIQDSTDHSWNRQTIQTVKRERNAQVNTQITVTTRIGTPPASYTETRTDTSRMHVIHTSTP